MWLPVYILAVMSVFTNNLGVLFICLHLSTSVYIYLLIFFYIDYICRQVDRCFTRNIEKDIFNQKNVKFTERPVFISQNKENDEFN
jgi:hypothetical protein